MKSRGCTAEERIQELLLVNEDLMHMTQFQIQSRSSSWMPGEAINILDRSHHFAMIVGGGGPAFDENRDVGNEHFYYLLSGKEHFYYPALMALHQEFIDITLILHYTM